jgi:class 3 adenylate cyclase/tetratricopeptide (TPR) repeat protein
VICPNCQTPNEATRKFCRQCGTRLTVVCSSCGAGNAPNDRFCGECGTALGQVGDADRRGFAGIDDHRPAGAAREAAPAAERRLVSVLFADLAGFTSLAEGRDAESIRELQERYFEAASGVVRRYGGAVEKYAGDAVMAVWGAPTAHEDDAERAVRAALDLVEAVQLVGEELRVDLSARAAIVTGEAAVATGHADQAMVSGDLVNTASRLQAVAPPSAVLVGETTYRAASEAIAFEPVGEQVLRGKVDPVPAYRALRVVARRGGAGRSEQLEPPFVGRQAELRMLKDFHVATAEERRPRIVSVMGQAGIGKSRLVWEYQKYLDGVTDVVYWHQGRSPAYGEGITFWALAEMVRGRAGISEGEELEQIRAKLSQALATWIADEGERAWLEPRLLQLLGAEPVPTGRRDHESLFAAWRTFFERIAEHGVVVLAFEDLQWADDGLLDFIEHVLDWSRDRPIYIVALARPEILDRRPDWGAGRRNFASLVLEPLADEEMRELLSGLVPGLPERAAARIVRRAEGIPLYAVEIVRMLLTEGRLARDDGTYRPLGDLSELTVPPSLHALVAARLDALDPADRALLQAASVLGKTFTVEALSAVSGQPTDEVSPRLRALVRRELLVLQAGPRSPERGQYGFVQSVVREVAYSTLGRRDRRRLHLGAARYFETLDDAGIAGALAEHYLAAYRAQPEGPEAEALAAQTRVALRAAADRAIGLGSFRQAASFFEAALDVTPDPRELAELHASAARALGMGAGLPDRAVPHAEKALELVRPLGDRARVLQAVTDLVTALRFARRAADATGMLEQAADDYADLAESPEYVELRAELARSLMLDGQHARVIEVVDRVLPTAERLDLPRTVLGLLITRGTSLGPEGRLLEAMAVLRGAISLADAHDYRDLQSRAFLNLSFVASTDDPALSYRIAREGLVLARRFGLKGPEDFLLANAALGAQDVGDWDWALAEADAVIAADPDSPNPSAHRARLTILGLRGAPVDDELAECLRLATDESRPDQVRANDEEAAADALMARGELENALRLSVSSYRHLPGPDVSSYRRAGRIAGWLGNVAAVRDALDGLPPVSGRVARATRGELEATLAALEGRGNEALSGFDEAIRLWRELGTRFHVALAQLTFVWLLGPGSADARRAAHEAREIFTTLRAEPLIRYLDEALTTKSIADAGARAARHPERATTPS